jgi:phosphatidylglycerol:prolipoprotein diacylglycerol transferase
MHPILFNLGGLEVRVYGLLVALSFLTGIYFSSITAKKNGIDPDTILDLGLVIIISAVIGARALYVIVWWSYYSQHIADIFKVWEGGLVFYGGFIGALLGAIGWIWHKKMGILKLGDIVMPYLALSHAIGRIGCFYNGCCYGAVNEKYGVIFPAINDNLRHLPTQLYESVLNFLNFVFLALLFRNGKRKEGDVFYMYFLNYGIIRFCLEIFRGDPERGFFFGLSTSMIISIVLVVTGIGGLISVRVIKTGKPDVTH